MGVKLSQAELEANARESSIALKEHLAESCKRLAESQAEANERWQRMAAATKRPLMRWLYLRWQRKGEASVQKNLQEHERYVGLVRKLRSQK